MRTRVALAGVRRRPWPALLLLSLCGWIGFAASSHAITVPGYCVSLARYSVERSWRDFELAFLLNPPVVMVASWSLMLLAMMPLLLARPIEHLWTRSLPRRRGRALALFAIGYLVVWLSAGALLTVVAVMLKVGLGWATPAVTGLGFLIAVIWQASPTKQVCLNACHRRPSLSAFGLAADRDRLCYGVTTGFSCFGVCWALMLVSLVANGAHLLAMVIASLILLVERQVPARPPKWRLPMPA